MLQAVSGSTWCRTERQRPRSHVQMFRCLRHRAGGVQDPQGAGVTLKLRAVGETEAGREFAGARGRE
jgi:hypothetical protein